MDKLQLNLPHYRILFLRKNKEFIVHLKLSSKEYQKIYSFCHIWYKNLLKLIFSKTFLNRRRFDCFFYISTQDISTPYLLFRCCQKSVHPRRGGHPSFILVTNASMILFCNIFHRIVHDIIVTNRKHPLWPERFPIRFPSRRSSLPPCQLARVWLIHNIYIFSVLV